MRILLVNDNHPPAFYGGSETSTVALASELARLGHDVHVLARYPTNEARAPFEDGFTFHPVRCDAPGGHLDLAVKDFLTHPRRLRRAIDGLVAAEGDFDVIHAGNAISAMAVARRGRARGRSDALRVVSVRSYSQVCTLGNAYCLDDSARLQCGSAFACALHTQPAPPGPVAIAKAAALAGIFGPVHPRSRATLDAADLLIADSEFVKRVVEQETGRSDVEVAHEAVLVEAPRPDDSSPHAAPARPRAPSALFVGRLTPQKGPHVLLDAFLAALPALAPEATLAFVGDGAMRGALEARAAAAGAGDRVLFLGRLPPERVASAQREARVCVVPSLWAEPFGIVAAESILRGTRAIVSDAGGLPEIVGRDGEAGRVVPAGATGPLAEALIQELSVDRPPSPVARSRVHEMTSPRALAERHLRLYAAAMQRRRPAATGR